MLESAEESKRRRRRRRRRRRSVGAVTDGPLLSSLRSKRSVESDQFDSECLRSQNSISDLGSKGDTEVGLCTVEVLRGIHISLFVGVFDTCLVWYLLVLPSETHAFANMTS